MTGFARADGAGLGYRWNWELRTVNGKGLDLRLRLPSGFDRLEIAVRERAGKHLTRGNCSFNLSLSRETASVALKVNEDALAAVLAALKSVAARIEATPPTLDGILGFKGVLEVADIEDNEATRAALDALLLASLDQALDALVKSRVREGDALALVLGGQIDAIERHARAAEANPARRPEMIRAKLAEQVRQLLDAVPQLDPTRLHQEAVLLATKADIREELDRLEAHIAQARALIGEGGPVGRRLDFLAQEFNRESNTLCSKSNDRELTATGLELKTVVDQFREQIQNVE